LTACEKNTESPAEFGLRSRSAQLKLLFEYRHRNTWQEFASDGVEITALIFDQLENSGAPPVV
jgi:hypothetical protein